MIISSALVHLHPATQLRCLRYLHHITPHLFIYIPPRNCVVFSTFIISSTLAHLHHSRQLRCLRYLHHITPHLFIYIPPRNCVVFSTFIISSTLAHLHPSTQLRCLRYLHHIIHTCSSTPLHATALSSVPSSLAGNPSSTFIGTELSSSAERFSCGTVPVEPSDMWQISQIHCEPSPFSSQSVQIHSWQGTVMY